MRPGDRVETPDGPGRLVDQRWERRRDMRGIWRDEAVFWVELYTSATPVVRKYEPGTVYPTEPGHG